MADVLSLYKRVSTLGDALTPEVLIARMQANRRLLWRLVGRLPFQMPACLDEDDILQEASLAVVRAFKTFDPSKGSIESWLAFTVRTQVRLWLRELYPLSRHRTRQLREALEAHDRLEQALQRHPTDEEVAGELGWKVSLLRDVLGAAPARELLSAEHVISATRRARPIEKDDPFERVWSADCERDLAEGLGRLSAMERRILSLHYEEGKSLREISACLGMPNSTVIWTHHRALLRLRAHPGLGGESASPGRGASRVGSSHRTAALRAVGAFVRASLSLDRGTVVGRAWRLLGWLSGRVLGLCGGPRVDFEARAASTSLALAYQEGR
jgi:RNA polymerase sigma factor for flagellar operon FliA